MSNATKNDRASHLVYVFGDFRLDTRRGALCRDGEVVPLRPKAYAVLLHLLRHHGELVTRADLLDAVWHNASVSDDSITQCIVEIRRAIDDPDRAKIRTIPRRGFVFEAPIQEHEAEDSHEIPAPAVADSRDRDAARWSRVATASVLLVIAAGLVAISLRNTDKPATEAASRPAIAVLAFADMTASGDRQYFADGVAEEILNHLSRIPELRVISRSSSFAFREEDRSLAEIAAALGVDFILEGSVRGTGDQLRITAQLIDADGDEHVWAEAYDREVASANLVRVQNDIAASVAAAIGVETGVRLTLPEERDYSVDPEAMDKFLRGMYYVHRIGSGAVQPGDHQVAIELMNAAIEIEPDWAQPHAAIGTVLHFYATSPYVTRDEVAETFEASRRHLLDAIRLDPNLGQAYASLAFVTHAYDLDFERAEALYARTAELGNQGSWGYAIMLRAMGRLDEAIDKYREAMLQNPISTAIPWQLADTLRCAGRYEEAAGHADGLLRILPDNPGLWEFRALLAVRLGDVELAEQIIEERSDPDQPFLFANVRAALGRREESLAILAEIERDPGWNPRGHAMIGVPIGEYERTLDYFERAAEAEPRTLALATCPDDLGPIATHPRYLALLETAGIPAPAAAASR